MKIPLIAQIESHVSETVVEGEGKAEKENEKDDHPNREEASAKTADQLRREFFRLNHGHHGSNTI